MGKIFLSHSSKDKKGFVDVIARNLEKKFGKQMIVYDKLTFETGNLSMDEIDEGIKSTDLFVVFLSETSLNSKFVQYEMNEANKEFINNKISNIYPIIIDPSVSYSDKRIPQWLKSRVINYIKKPTIIEKRIISKFSEIQAITNPKNFEKANLFLGRYELLDKFADQLIDSSSIYSETVAKCFVASGPEGIGRRSLLRKGLSDASLIDRYEDFLKITLNRNESIEDFILQMHEICNKEELCNLNELITTSMEDKIKLAIELVDEVANDTIILIIDDICIINHEGEVCDWFKEIVDSSKFEGKSLFSIVSTRRLNDFFLDDQYIKINVPELLPKDRRRIFTQLCKLEDVSMDREELGSFLDLFNGYPGQIYYAVELIKSLSVKNTLLRAKDISDFGTRRAELLLFDYLSRDDFANTKEFEILRLLVEFENSISYSTVYEIIGYVDDNYSILNDFYIMGIIERSTIDPEYLKVNSSIQDFVSRMGLEIAPEYKSKLSEYLDSFLKDADYETHDITDTKAMLKESMLLGKDVKKSLLIPSYYLKTVSNLFNVKRTYSKVIKFVDIALKYERYIDSSISYSLRYYLCRALAKNRNSRFFDEVKHLNREDSNLLKGMYHRYIGRTELAIDYLSKCLSNKKNSNIAKRELVHAYLNLEAFEEAREYAREFFEKDKKNPHLAYNYFRCIYGHEKDHRTENEIIEVIDALKEMKGSVANEFGLRCEGLYHSRFKNDDSKAIELIDKAIESVDFKVYGLIDKFNIAENMKSIPLMDSTIEDILKATSNSEWIDYKEVVTKFKAILLTHQNKYDVAIELIKEHSKEYNSSGIERILPRLTKINDQVKKNESRRYNGNRYN